MRYATDATTRRCGSISHGGLLLGERNDDDSEQSGHPEAGSALILSCVARSSAGDLEVWAGAFVRGPVESWSSPPMAQSIIDLDQQDLWAVCVLYD